MPNRQRATIFRPMTTQVSHEPSALELTVNGERRDAAPGSTLASFLAELELDPRQIDAFTTAVREVGQVSVRAEEGCLALYAVADSDNPSRVHVFEIYRDSAAYQAHLQTPHFQRFRATTNSMVLSRKLLDATPVSIATKPGFTP